MIKLERTVTPSADQWEIIIEGMRNPMNSWDQSDSKRIEYVLKTEEVAPGIERTYWAPCAPYIEIGPNDLKVMNNLSNAGKDHRKYMRMIVIYVNITAPLYWWKEFDTYKVGTVANSCSTMHKIHAKKFEIDDFSCEHLFVLGENAGWEDVPRYNNERWDAKLLLELNIESLNYYRDKFLETKDKKYWWQMIQLLSSSYNQKRTIMLSYEVLANIYHSRKNHKLDEWHVFCDWIEKLPYSEIITGEIGKAVFIETQAPEVANPEAMDGFVDIWPDKED